MKLMTVWDPTINFTLRERLRRTQEVAIVSIASHLPRKVKYWSFVLQGARYMHADEVVPDVRYMDLLQRMEKDNN